MLKSARRSFARSFVPSLYVLLLTVAVAFTAQGSVIDTSPYDLEMSQGGGSGPDVAGGSFTADDDYLNSFTLYVGSVGGDPNNNLRAVIMAVEGGEPTGSPIWTSRAIQAPGALDEYLFVPNLPIQNGTEYFIGIDSGILTSALGGDFTIGLTSGDPLAGGQVFYKQNGAPFWLTSGASDIATRIEMSNALLQNPEPSTALLLGMGLAILGARKRSTSV